MQASTPARTAIIFGGSGFVGLHLSLHLVKQCAFDHVVLADVKKPNEHPAYKLISPIFDSGQITFIPCDVREPIVASDLLSLRPILIANLAAVHREPGHQLHEYWETNIPGAENVCGYAEKVECNSIIFTSSISPYGPTEEPKDEAAIPLPETPYGSSKLAAEYIHKVWQAKSPQSRKLTIARPGVIFGPGEGGNVSRLVKFIAKNEFFIYAGNKRTRKAGIYIKELCDALMWAHLEVGARSYEPLVVNMSFNPGATMQEFVDAVASASGRRVRSFEIPPSLLMLVGAIVHGAGSLVGRKTAFDPVRLRKTIRSNNIIPSRLVKEGYKYKYSLAEAFLDWRRELPEEWK